MDADSRGWTVGWAMPTLLLALIAGCEKKSVAPHSSAHAPTSASESITVFAAASVKRDNPLIDRSRRTCTAVYRMIDGKAVLTPVRRGASDDTHSQILEGLKEGDVVVVGPYKVLESLKHNDLIKLDDGKKEGSSNPNSEEKGGVQVEVG